MRTSLLETFPNPRPGRDYDVALHCLEFTSLSQTGDLPEFAEIRISYAPDAHCIERKSLKYYLGEFRSTVLTREEVARRILDDLAALVQPRRMTVTAFFHTSGDQHSVTADYRSPSV